MSGGKRRRRTELKALGVHNQINPDINFKVFVYKVQRLQDNNKTDESPKFEQFPLDFHLTSIYDHSL
ncbi:hypothetical protein BDR03DRAFT_1019864 [Suillus americanus]|nr:hypothetical protein BDR03DRAFT_1019864 [Suillus americanus]